MKPAGEPDEMPRVGDVVTIQPRKAGGSQHAITGRVTRCEDDECIANPEWFLTVGVRPGVAWSFRVSASDENNWTPKARSLLKIKGTWKVVSLTRSEEGEGEHNA